MGVAAEPTQSLSSVNLQTMHPLKNAGTADWSRLGSFSDPHQTRTNIWKRLLKFFFGKRSGAVASVLDPLPKGPWIETWLRYACTHSGLASPLPRGLLHIAQPVFAGTCAIFTAMSGGNKAQTTREEGAERGKQEKERRTEEKKEPN